MNTICVGQVFEEFIGQPSCIRWEMREHARLIAQLSSDIIVNFKLGGHYDFACTPIDNIMFFCARWGENDYLSAPFSPHLADYYKPCVYEEGEGMPLEILLICTDTGELVDMDFLVLGNDFSNQISRLSEKLLKESFDNEEYSRSIAEVYQKFATDNEIAELTDIKYSID
ncbi:MAG: hypothetical protein K5917_03955 [Clostridiales bacterium]|nr:hypothetical protein [Clostridiales bacterium]